jgi:DNA adenine methylase
MRKQWGLLQKAIYCTATRLTHSHNPSFIASGVDLTNRFRVIRDCKKRGVYVALSIDGTKRSGTTACDVSIPTDLFEREIMIYCGRSILKRFQMNGKTLEKEIVHDRLLLTY